MNVEIIPEEIKSKILTAYTLRRVPEEKLTHLITGVQPEAGDLVLAQISRLGQHRNLQRTNRVRKKLFVGDFVAVAYANRYASNQFEAVVPRTLGACQLVAGGGCAGKVLSKNRRMRHDATQLTPLGLITDSCGTPPLNLADFALAPSQPVIPRVPVIAVVGSAMDSGKTTAAANLTRGLSQGGYSVGYAKITGTGASGDPGFLLDAGASEVLDFTDVGYASTYKLDSQTCQRIMGELVDHLQSRLVDVVVMEVADGLLQQETAALIRSESFRRCVDGIILAASDAMSAVCGNAILESLSLPTIGLAGMMELSPLQRREAEESTGQPFLEAKNLLNEKYVAKLLQGVEQGILVTPSEHRAA